MKNYPKKRNTIWDFDIDIKLQHAESMVKESFVTCGIVSDKDFELGQLNTRLRNILKEKDDWDK